MKHFWPTAVLLLVFSTVALALSVNIDRDLNFPKNFDSARAEAIRSVIRDEKFHFLGGIVSYWAPNISTRLSYTGDAGAFNEFCSALRKLPGMGLRVILYRGRNDELRRDSPWQLDFSHLTPDQLTIYLNLNAADMDFSEIKLPYWPPSAP